MASSDLSALSARARAGDPRAQYELAAMLARAGRPADADGWLRRAAEGGEPDALFTVATRALSHSSTIADAAKQMRLAAKAGSTAAQRLSASLVVQGFDTNTDWNAAIKQLLAAAKSGDIVAQRETALLLFESDADDPTGVALLANSARGDAPAAAVEVARAASGQAVAESSGIGDALKNLQAASYPRAEILDGQLKKLGADVNSIGYAAVSWEDIRERCQDVVNWSAPQTERISSSPKVGLFRQIFPPWICEYVVAVGARQLRPSFTIDPKTGVSRRDAFRTSMTATVGPADCDVMLALLNFRLAILAGVPPNHGEFLSILRYKPLEEYKPHFDWLPENEDRSRSGQRVATALLYLNNDYDGGETQFTSAGISVQGDRGDVLVFRNVTDNGEPDLASKHAGLPVTRGEKWLASKWLRARQYHF
ncbi:MAG: 2OG-Fe(II) oxygenase [Pseudomonadota bacterium]